MNRERWCTKEDVLKDLAVATGRAQHLDSSYLVVGGRPPPRPVCEPDDEMEFMFRDALGEKPADVAIAPDLRGITEMIRMVQGYADTSSDCDAKVCTTRPKSPCDIISISKLNPNVKEFQPRGSVSCVDVVNKPVGDTSTGKNKVYFQSDPTSVRTHDSGSGKSIDKRKKDAVDKQADRNCNDILKDGSNSNKENADESEDITEKLRNKIRRSDKNGVSTFQVKKERNVAIANLQRLLSVQRDGDGTKDTEQPAKPVKLLTPDYYERPKTVALAEENESKNGILHKPENENAVPSNISNCTSSKPSLSGCEVMKKILHSKLNGGMRTSSDPGITNNARYSKSDTKSFSTSSEIKMDDSGSNEKLVSDTNLSDPQVRDSIKKVNNWLNKNDGKPVEKTPAPPISSPSPPVFLSSITFKRKEAKTSPNVSETKISKPSQNPIDQYKPSAYAEELSKMYMKRVEKIKKTKEKNGWANLEELLKEKDEKIKQDRLKAQSEASCDSQ